MKKLKSALVTGLLAGIVVATTSIGNAQDSAKKPMGQILPLPPVVFDANGNKVPTEALRGKVVALYFSAAWCVPCKKFTPHLVKFRDANFAKGFEVVFMSLDNSAAAKEKYMKKSGMKWLTAPGQDTKEINYILDYYKQPGIPSLIVFGPNGELITADGRSAVTDTPGEALAKWKASLRKS